MATETTFETSQIMVDFTQMKSFGQNPLILESGKGIRVTDVFGKSYIDGLSGVFTVNLGHGIEEFADIAAAQMRKISVHRADDGDQPAGAAAGRPADRDHPRAIQHGQVLHRRLGGERGRDQNGAPVSHPNRPPPEAQDHLPLQELSRRHRQRDGRLRAGRLEVALRAFAPGFHPRHPAEPARLLRLRPAGCLLAGLHRPDRRGDSQRAPGVGRRGDRRADHDVGRRPRPASGLFPAPARAVRSP